MSISMAKLIESPSHIIYLFDYYHFKQSDSSEGMTSEQYAETSTWNIDKLSQVNEDGCSCKYLLVYVPVKLSEMPPLSGDVLVNISRCYWKNHIF